jgi:hypothetical protein
MTTLTTAPLAGLLDTLLQEDAASEENFTKLPYSFEEMERLMQSKTGYLDFYGQLKELPLAVSRETGLLLYILGTVVTRLKPTKKCT